MLYLANKPSSKGKRNESLCGLTSRTCWTKDTVNTVVGTQVYTLVKTHWTVCFSKKKRGKKMKEGRRKKEEKGE